MRIKVSYLLRDLIGKDEIKVKKKNTVKELINLLDKKYKGFAKEAENYSILVNGKVAEQDTKLIEKSIISFISIIYGG